MRAGEKRPAWLCNAQEMGSECNPPSLLPFHTQLARERRESVQPGMPEPDDAGGMRTLGSCEDCFSLGLEKTSRV